MPHVYGTYPEDVWRARYDQINDFERELAASGCAILKIFLVVSQEEQKKHFLGRLDDPTKFWKFDISDLEARDRWDEYMAAWQEVFEKTSTAAAPWYLVPADNRWYSRAVAHHLEEHEHDLAAPRTRGGPRRGAPPVGVSDPPTGGAKRMARLFAWLRPLAGGVA